MSFLGGIRKPRSAGRAAGHIAWHASSEAILGTGKTAADAKRVIREQTGAREYREWVKDGLLLTSKATQRLIDDVEAYGGDGVPYRIVDGVADLAD